MNHREIINVEEIWNMEKLTDSKEGHKKINNEGKHGRRILLSRSQSHSVALICVDTLGGLFGAVGSVEYPRFSR